MDEFKHTFSVREFNKLSLEERARIALKNYFYESIKIKGEDSLIDFMPYLEAWAFLEKNNYVRLATEQEQKDSKLISMDAPYKITKAGNEFMDS